MLTVKISKTELKLMLIFGGLLVFIALYFLVYNPTLEENAILDTEIATLQPQLEELKTYEANYETYVANIDTIKANIANQLDLHPSKIEEEEFLVWAIDLEEDNEMDITTVGFGAEQNTANFPLYINTGADTDTMVNIDAGRATLTAVASFSYEEIKNAINDIYSYKHSTALDTITITYNAATGELMGNLAISKYYINYVDAPYTSVPMPTVPVGNDNPFGSLEAAAPADAE